MHTDVGGFPNCAHVSLSFPWVFGGQCLCPGVPVRRRLQRVCYRKTIHHGRACLKWLWPSAPLMHTWSSSRWSDIESPVVTTRQFLSLFVLRHTSPSQNKDDERRKRIRFDHGAIFKGVRATTSVGEEWIPEGEALSNVSADGFHSCVVRAACQR